MIQKGNVVAVHYTGKLTNGEVFDSSEGRDPLKFQVGSGQIIPGFEDAIIGKNIGDRVTVNISPKEAYGEVREDLIVQVPLEQMPGEVEVGQSLQAQADNGQAVNVIVKEVNKDHVVIDGNHPLSGMTLEFEIEVLEIENAQ
jgi:FKBP-type peptidyl-prolyl cis-trans isomerase 2